MSLLVTFTQQVGLPNYKGASTREIEVNADKILKVIPDGEGSKLRLDLGYSASSMDKHTAVLENPKVVASRIEAAEIERRVKTQQALDMMAPR